MKTLLVGIILANLINNTITLADVNNTQQTQENVSTVANLPLYEKVAIKYSSLYGASSTEVIKVMQCESGFKMEAVGDSGKSNGIAQFNKGTFEQYSKQLGEKLDYNSLYDQIKLMSYMFSINKGNHWTAYRALKNGGTYTFYSSVEKQWITSYCK